MSTGTEGAQATPEAPGATSAPSTAPTGSTALTSGNAPTSDSGDGNAPAGDKKPEGDAGNEGGKAADKLEIEYTDFEMPEGIVVDEEALGKFTPVAKELGLDQAGAQKLVSIYAEMQAESQRQFADQVAQWGEAAKNDAEYGGAKFDESLGVAVRGLQAFATPELTQLLNDTGLGNHPEMIRAFYKIGRALTEDKAVAPPAAAADKKSTAAVLYGGN